MARGVCALESSSFKRVKLIKFISYCLCWVFFKHVGDTKQAKSQIIIPNTQWLTFKKLSKFDVLAQICMDGWQILPPIYRVSNQISATTYIQMHVSQEWKELWSPFLHHLVALVKCWSHTKSKATALNHVGARDENVTLSDYSNNQTFVPNFRLSLFSPPKKTLGEPDVRCMTTYPRLHWPPNFSP